MSSCKKKIYGIICNVTFVLSGFLVQMKFQRFYEKNKLPKLVYLYKLYSKHILIKVLYLMNGNKKM